MNNPVWIGRYGPDGGKLQISTPTTEAPEDPFYIQVWADFISADGESPYEVDQVVEVTATPGVEITSEFMFDFYEE